MPFSLSTLWNGAVSTLWPYILAAFLAVTIASGTTGYLVGHRAAVASTVPAIVRSNTVQHKAATSESRSHTIYVTKVVTQTKILKEKVPVYVKDNRACDVGADVISLLNSANH